MTELVITGAGLCGPPAGALRAEPQPVARFPEAELRRVTRLCRLALPAVEGALAQARLQAGAELELGLVVGTALAALDETAGFLEAVHTRGARFGSPQKFQRSVHGALAGELAILYGWRGHNLTVTQGLASGEAALYLGALAVRSGRAARCLVVAADEAPLVVSERLPELPSGEGAAAVILERAEEARSRGAAVLATLGPIDLEGAERDAGRHGDRERTYGAYGLVRLVVALQGAGAPRSHDAAR